MTARIAFCETALSGTGIRALTAARELGHETVFLARDPDYYRSRRSPYPPDLGLADHHVVCDTNDVGTVVRELAPYGVAAVLSVGEHHVWVAAEAAARLGAAGLHPAAAARCRDKEATYAAAAAHGLRAPRGRRVTTAAAARRVTAELPGPWVVKPADGTGSSGVLRCGTAAEVAAAVESGAAPGRNARGQTTLPGMVVCEYVDGPEYSVELAADGHRVVPVGVTGKHLGPPPHFVEQGHVFPAPVPDETAAALVAFAREALTAVGFDIGVAHVEIRGGPDGPVLVEVNARPPGDRIVDLVESATGLDLCRLLVQSHLSGGLPDVRPAGDGRAAARAADGAADAAAAAVSYLLADRPGTLRGVAGVDAALAVPGVREVRVLARPGTAVRGTSDSHGRLAAAVSRAPDPREARAAAEAAIGRLRPEYDASSAVCPPA